MKEIPSRPAQGFYSRIGKRCLDVTCAGLGLLLTSPLLAACGIAVRLNSSGPALYSQERVGRDGRVFRILKFRSMRIQHGDPGPLVTVGGDTRVTKVGRFLRRYKLDELPQLWNVLVGDMSLVGPRPEVPSYTRLYTREQLRVLTVRPGVTDIASLVYRNEEEVLRSSSDPERCYRETVMPHKLALNLQYIDRISFSTDLSLIMRTITAVAIGASATPKFVKAGR